MTDAVTPAGKVATAEFDLSARIAWPVQLVAYLLLAVLCFRARGDAVLNHDVSWLMVAADRWLNGGVLGVDIVELNTPGAVLMYVPAAWLAGISGIGVTLAVTLMALGVALASSIMTAQIVAWRAGLPAQSRLAFLTGILGFSVLALFLSYEFAQRDHFIAMMFLPYAVLNAPLPATKSSAPPARLAIAATVLAAIAVCIKPQYVVLFAIAFLMLARQKGVRTAWTQCRAWLIIGIGVAYIAVVVIFFGDWLPVAASANRLYAAYDMPLGHLFAQAMPTALLLLAGWTISTLRVAQAEVLNTMAWMGGGVLLIALVQGKGWYYHFLAADIFVLVGAIIVLAAFLPIFARHSRHLVAVLFVIILVPVFVGDLPYGVNEKRRVFYENSQLTLALRKLAQPGDSVGFIATSLPPAFPLITEEGYLWPSRYPTLWPVAGAITLGQSGRIDAATRAAVLTETIDNVVADFRRNPPQVIVVDERQVKLRVPDGFEFLPVFLENAAFRDFWSGYRLAGSAEDYALYQRIAD